MPLQKFCVFKKGRFGEGAPRAGFVRLERGMKMVRGKCCKARLDPIVSPVRKYLSVHNGKLTREFDKLYKLLHIAGYYRGLLEDVTVVKNSFKAAKEFINKIGR